MLKIQLVLSNLYVFFLAIDLNKSSGQRSQKLKKKLFVFVILKTWFDCKEAGEDYRNVTEYSRRKNVYRGRQTNRYFLITQVRQHKTHTKIH